MLPLLSRPWFGGVYTVTHQWFPCTGFLEWWTLCRRDTGFLSSATFACRTSRTRGSWHKWPAAWPRQRNARGKEEAERQKAARWRKSPAAASRCWCWTLQSVNTGFVARRTPPAFASASPFPGISDTRSVKSEKAWMSGSCEPFCERSLSTSLEKLYKFPSSSSSSHSPRAQSVSYGKPGSPKRKRVFTCARTIERFRPIQWFISVFIRLLTAVMLEFYVYSWILCVVSVKLKELRKQTHGVENLWEIVTCYNWFLCVCSSGVLIHHSAWNMTNFILYMLLL